jgi:hypothetical protein
MSLLHHSAHQSIETAVPLEPLQVQRIHGPAEQRGGEEVATEEGTPSDYVSIWYMNFFLFGSYLGILSGAVMYAALAYSLHRFGEFPTVHLLGPLDVHHVAVEGDKNHDQEHMLTAQYVALWCATRLGESIHLAIFAVLLYLLTPGGSRWMVGIFQSTLDSGSPGGWTGPCVYRCVVFLQGGLLFGSTCAVIAIETVLGIRPLSIASLSTTVFVNLAMYVAVIKSYDFQLQDEYGDDCHGTVTMPERKSAHDEDSAYEQSIAYVAIV